MDQQIQMVKEFHLAFGRPYRYIPQAMPPEEIELRVRLLREEIDEFEKAAKEGNVLEMADGLVDLLYVLYGTAWHCGLAMKLTRMFHEVHNSNMSKLGADGKPIIREDGKILKGPNFKKPDLESIIF